MNIIYLNEIPSHEGINKYPDTNRVIYIHKAEVCFMQYFKV